MDVEELELGDDGDVPDDSAITYRVIEAASKRGKAKLVSSDGFAYTVKRKWVILVYVD